MKKLIVVMVARLALVGCGGGDDAEDIGGTEAPADTNAPVATEAPAGGTDDTVQIPTEAEGKGVATATVNGETYHFGDTGFPGIQCMPDFFGVMLGVQHRVDDEGNAVDGGGLVQFALLREGTDPEVVDQTDELVVKIETGDFDQEWTADVDRYDDREIPDDSSQVQSLTFSGNTVSGTANVYDDEAYWGAGGDPAAVPTATVEFEITCFQ